MTNNFKADAFLAFYNGGLAGNGIRFHIAFEYNYLKQKAKQEWNIPFKVISRKIQTFQGFECSLIGTPPSPDYEFDSTEETKDIYNNSFVIILNALEDLYDQGKRNILFLQRGYISYGLWAVKRAQEVLQARDKNLNIRIVWDDSSDPDTDEASYDLDYNSIPISRFYAPAYKDTYGLIYNWHKNPSEDLRIMPNMAGHQMVSNPYPQKYLDWLKQAANISQAEAREKISKIFPFMNFDIKENDLLIPIMASGGCFQQENVDKWMTLAQYESVVTCTKNILNGLQKATENENKKIFIACAPECVELMEKFFKKSKNLIAIPLNVISQENILYMYLASDTVIQRATHSISASQSPALKQLCLTAVMPALGYMDVEKMAQDVTNRGLGIVLDWSDEKLGEKIFDIIKKDKAGELNKIKQNGYDEFYKVHEGEGNVFKVIEKLAGF